MKRVGIFTKYYAVQCPSSFESQNDTFYCEVQFTRKSYSEVDASLGMAEKKPRLLEIKNT
jgi:hypothetical protein